MFSVLNKLLKEYDIPLSDFEGNNFPLSDRLMDVLDELISMTKWRKSRKFELLQRSRKMIMNKTFSIRDKKLLSKLVNQQKRQGFINYEEIVYYFPGKTAKMLEIQYVNRKTNGSPKTFEI